MEEKEETLSNVDLALKLLKESTVSNYKVAKKTRISQSTIGNYVNGKTKPTRANAEILIQFFNNLGNEETIEAVEKQPSDQKAEFVMENSNGAKFYDLGGGKYRMSVPRVPYCAYGRFANEADTLEPDLEDWDREFFEVNQLAHGKYLSFEVKGNSMDDGTRISFEEGDIILVRELDPMYWKDGIRYNKYPYWVIVFDNSVLIKQIIDQDMETGDIVCHSLNKSPEYADFKLNLNNVRKLYNVIKKKARDVEY